MFGGQGSFITGHIGIAQSTLPCLQAHALQESSFHDSPSCLGQKRTFKPEQDIGGPMGSVCSNSLASTACDFDLARQKIADHASERFLCRACVDTRLANFSIVNARGFALLDDRALRATATGCLVLPGTLQHRAGLLCARDRRIGAGAVCAVIRVELFSRGVQHGADHARAFRRRQESSATCITKSVV